MVMLQSSNLSDEIMNFSDDNVQDTQEAKFSVDLLVSLLVAALTVFTNALILAAFYAEKKLRTYNNWYILNITIADLVVGLLCMPVRATIFLYDGWHYGRVPGALLIGFQNSILSVSVYGLVVICIDRYIATFYPIKHFQQKSIRKATVVNIFTWALSFGLWMMIACVWDIIQPSDAITKSGLYRPNYTSYKAASVFTSIMRFAAPFGIIGLLYIRIYLRVNTVYSKRVSSKMKKNNLKRNLTSKSNKQSTSHSMGQQIDDGADDDFSRDPESVNASDAVQVPSVSFYVQEHHSGCVKEPDIKRPTATRKKLQQESRTDSHKAMRTLTLVIIAFVVTWSPNGLYVMVYSVSPSLYATINAVVNMQETTRWISFGNSLVNPVAYAMAQPLIRDTVLKILCCKRAL